MEGTKKSIENTRVHQTANNQRLLKRITKSSSNKGKEDPLPSSSGQILVSKTGAKKPHHNAGKTWGKPFKKGHRPYKHDMKTPISLLDELREELASIPTKEKDGFDGKGKSNAYWLIHNYVAEARDAGNIQAIRDILDRLEGKPATTIQGSGGGPIQIAQTIHDVIDEGGIQDAIGALVECGAIAYNPN